MLLADEWKRYPGIAHDHEVNVISEPRRARPRSSPLEDHRKASGQDPVQILVSGTGPDRDRRHPVRFLPENIHETLAVIVKLALRQGKHVHYMRAPG